MDEWWAETKGLRLVDRRVARWAAYWAGRKACHSDSLTAALWGTRRAAKWVL